MATTPQFVQARKTTLLVGISSAEDGTIVLKNLVDAYGNPLAMSDFGAILYLTLDPGGDSEEIMSLTGFTVNSDGSVDIDTGIVRGLMAKYPYTTGGFPSAHAAGITVVASNEPQFYQAIIDYINGVAISGAPNANSTTKGILQVATAAQINAGTALGSTGAALAITPDQLALSNYGLNIPTTAQKAFLTSVIGICFPFMGTLAPSGMVMCDGSAYSNDTYPLTCGQALGYFGYGTGAVFTANASTDVITANAHGFVNGNRLLLDSTNTLPAGLSKNTIYFVISATTNTFQLATSSGGLAINITDTGTGTHGAYNQFRVPDIRGSFPIGAGTRTSTRVYDSTITTETDPQMGQVIIPTSPCVVSSYSTGLGGGIQFNNPHGLVTGDTFYFTGSAPGGLSTGTIYFAIVNSTSNITPTDSYNDALQGIGVYTLSSTTVGGALVANGYFNSPKAQAGWVVNGTKVALTTSGTAPTGLSAGTYYAVIVPSYPTRIYLATSQTNAQQGSPDVLVTAVGVGFQTLAATLTPRSLGASSGEEVHVLTLAELAVHLHTGNFFLQTSGSTTTTGSNGGGTGYVPHTTQTANAGGNGAHNNIPPNTALNWITLAA